MGFMTGLGFRPTPYKGTTAADYRENLMAAMVKAAEEAENAQYSSWEEMVESVNTTTREIHNIETANCVLDDAIVQARKVGVDEHLVVAIESVRPGLLDESTRMYATSVPSKTNAEKTVVALESARNYGKFAIIAMLIAVILKIIAWVINNGGNAKGTKEGDVVSQQEEIKEKAGEARGKDKDGKFSNFHDTVLARYLEVQKDDATDGDKTKLAKLIPIGEQLSAAINAHPGLNALIIAIDSKGGKPLITSVFEEAMKSGSDEAATATFVNNLRNAGVLSIFYNPRVIASLLKHPKLKGSVGLNRRMPTVSMWHTARGALDRTVGMVDLFNSVLVKPDESNVADLYKVVESFMQEFLLNGQVFEQPRMSDAAYETPFTQRMSEASWSEGYMALGTRLMTLSEAGSIGKLALSPIYTELGNIPFVDMLDAVGTFADEALQQNGGQARFKDVIKVDTQWAKRAKARMEGYNKTIKRLKGDEARQLLAVFEEQVSKVGGRPTDNMRTVDGDTSEPFDLLSDMAKCMRSLWETYAALQQCAEKHNNYSSLMRSFAEARK